VSKYFNDASQASLPGGLELSNRKLEELEPELFDDRTFKCGPTCDTDHPADSIRERLTEHLELGCCGAALVVSTSPLVIAVYGEDLDASVLLRFPSSFVERYGLSVGKRLVAVNAFQDVRADGGEVLYAADLIPGPARTNWSGFHPCIAEFMSDQADVIEQRRREIPEKEWEAVERTAKLRIDRMGLQTARDGKPSQAGFPNRMGASMMFLPIHDFDSPVFRNVVRVLGIVLAVAAGIGWVLFKTKALWR
jgi:hypothetical protein